MLKLMENYGTITLKLPDFHITSYFIYLIDHPKNYRVIKIYKE